MPVEQPEALLSPSLSQVIQVALHTFQDDLHTCAWGQVLGYDAASQTASVQLTPRYYIDADGERQSELPAPLSGVPVIFPGSGNYSITFPIAAGDHVLVVFGEHSFDGAASGQVTADVGDDRKHSLSDAVCIPGLRSKGGRIAGPPPNNALVVNAPDQVRLGSKNASQAVVVQSALDFFGLRLNLAITNASPGGSSPNPTTVTVLTALQTALGINPLTGTGWDAGTSKAKAE